MMLRSLTILGDSGEEYVIDTSNDDGSLYCSCRAFRFSSASPRTCKHLKFAASLFVK